MTLDRRFADMLHHRAKRLGRGDPVAPPLVSATTYHLPSLEDAAHKYGRMAMPTWEEVEEQLAILEGATVVGFPSGMAAITAALFCTAQAGGEVILPSDGYYTTRLLTEQFLAPLGVKVRLIATANMVAQSIDAVLLKTGTASSASTSLTVTDATGIVADMPVSGTGIATGAFVASVAGTTITLSAATTAAITAGQVFFGGPLRTATTCRVNVFDNAI
jgi:O-acetylhomoserine/O-acetylserine sulfhydrylase-like pyridoxal-dependent enzyme